PGGAPLPGCWSGPASTTARGTARTLPTRSRRVRRAACSWPAAALGSPRARTTPPSLTPHERLMGRPGQRIRRRIARLRLGPRRELLRVVLLPDDVRTDAIRQLYERPGTRDLAEVLMDLEAEPEVRVQVIEVLKASV